MINQYEDQRAAYGRKASIGLIHFNNLCCCDVEHGQDKRQQPQFTEGCKENIKSKQSLITSNHHRADLNVWRQYYDGNHSPAGRFQAIFWILLGLKKDFIIKYKDESIHLLNMRLAVRSPKVPRLAHPAVNITE